MPELVRVSNVEKMDGLQSYINEQVARGKYAEIIQAIGMYSLLIDPEHTIADQERLYRQVLGLLKDKIRSKDPRIYALWLDSFPRHLDRIVEQEEIDKDASAQNVLLFLGPR
jgi:hypothetical protein